MVPKNKIKEVLQKQLENISPSEQELSIIKAKTKEILDILNQNIKRAKISAEIFVGGSFAKNTLIRKKKYDIDIFVRFDSKKYQDEEISGILGKIAPKNAVKVHGSRDYFSVEFDHIKFEIIPTLKAKNPKEAKNITDLSYFHVSYIEKQIAKNKKLADEIRLAKAFAYYQECYGAESYISGFSGYAIELLIVCYKNFERFIGAIAKSDVRKEKIVLDPGKLYKKREEILRELNESKLLSPIVVVDPTFMERNALAALSFGTFLKFQDACRRFLKNPSSKFFELENKAEKMGKKYGSKLIKLELSTEKQRGDIAGTKLKKFSGFFMSEAERYFDIKDSLFEYDEEKNIGGLYIACELKKEIIFPGPPIKMKKPLAEFRKEHKNIRIKAGKAYAVEKNKLDFEKFLAKLENEKSKQIEDMAVSGISLS